ncbi:MAG: hypothetical protein V7609_3338 [Verrucomicrobiota bacterium]
MSLKEKYLYHQIHPLKLITDIGAGFGSLYPLWHHHLGFALVVMLAPPPLISLLLMGFADLEPYRQSALGKYIAQSMSHAMEAIRLIGMIIVALGAWYHSLWIIFAGCAVVLFAWLRGIFSNT